MARGVTVSFNAEVARFTSSVDKITNDLSRFQTNADRVSKNVDRSFSRLGNGLKGVFGGLTAALSVRELGTMADSFSNIQARLKLATRDANEFALANENIKRIAEGAKSPLESTATLYTRISQSLLDVGGTQKQVADVTQALALSMRLSGATAAESASAMLQFSQAIGSGVLRGEEFNAVNEAAPRAMKALADALNVPVSQLRNLAQEGKITRDILVDALGSQLPQLLKEAETLPNTIGASLTDLGNKLLLTIGQLDKLTGASGKTANLIGDVGSGALKTIALLGANVAFVFGDVYRELGGIGERLAALASGDFKGLDGIGQRLKRETAAARRELKEFQNELLNPGKAAPVATDDGSATKRLAAIRFGDDESVKSAKKAADERAKILQHEIEFELKEFNDYHKARDAALKDQIAFESRQSEEFYRVRDKAANDAKQALEALNKEGQNLKLSVDPMARMNAEIERYSVLLKQDAIDQKTFDLAVAQSTDNMKKATTDGFEKMSAAAIGFQTNVQSTLGQGLYNAMTGKFDNIFDAWKDLLFRMVSAGLASQVTDSIFGANGKGGLLKAGLSILGSLGSLGKAPKAGALGSSTFGQSLWPVPKFAAGGNFMGGLRLVGENGPELEATGPSRIFNANQTKNILNGGGKSVSVNYSPVIQIDSRTDRNEVHAIVSRAVKQGNADLIDKLDRQGRI